MNLRSFYSTQRIDSQRSISVPLLIFCALLFALLLLPTFNSYAQESSWMIRRLQQELARSGSPSLVDDGFWGPKTKAALRKFQRSNNQPVSGRFDSETAKALGLHFNSPHNLGPNGIGHGFSGRKLGTLSVPVSDGFSAGEVINLHGGKGCFEDKSEPSIFHCVFLMDFRVLHAFKPKALGVVLLLHHRGGNMGEWTAGVVRRQEPDGPISLESQVDLPARGEFSAEGVFEKTFTMAVYEHAESDARCCPSLKRIHTYSVQDTNLAAISLQTPVAKTEQALSSPKHLLMDGLLAADPDPNGRLPKWTPIPSMGDPIWKKTEEYLSKGTKLLGHESAEVRNLGHSHLAFAFLQRGELLKAERHYALAMDHDPKATKEALSLISLQRRTISSTIGAIDKELSHIAQRAGAIPSREKRRRVVMALKQTRGLAQALRMLFTGELRVYMSGGYLMLGPRAASHWHQLLMGDGVMIDWKADAPLDHTFHTALVNPTAVERSNFRNLVGDGEFIGAFTDANGNLIFPGISYLTDVADKSLAMGDSASKEEILLDCLRELRGDQADLKSVDFELSEVSTSQVVVVYQNNVAVQGGVLSGLEKFTCSRPQ